MAPGEWIGLGQDYRQNSEEGSVSKSPSRRGDGRGWLWALAAGLEWGSDRRNERMWTQETEWDWMDPRPGLGSRHQGTGGWAVRPGVQVGCRGLET